MLSLWRWVKTTNEEHDCMGLYAHVCAPHAHSHTYTLYRYRKKIGMTHSPLPIIYNIYKYWSMFEFQQKNYIGRNFIPPNYPWGPLYISKVDQYWCMCLQHRTTHSPSVKVHHWDCADLTSSSVTRFDGRSRTTHWRHIPTHIFKRDRDSKCLCVF